MAKRTRKKIDAAKLPSRVLAMCEARGLGAILLHEPIMLGVSGGADSLALLHILLELRSGTARKTLRVGHLDHRFRGTESAADLEFVASFCQEWGVSFIAATFDVPAYAAAHRLSGEDAARRARYAFLGRLAQERNASVAVAHTADDQAETVLMNIIRGTGISGLGGMRWLSSLPPIHGDADLTTLGSQSPTTSTHLFRPLLGTWREEIEAYCRINSLHPRFDSSNLDMAYRRNRVRHELIPLLSTNYNSSVKRHLWQLAEVAAEEDDAMEAVVEKLWPTLILEDSPPGKLRIEVSKLAGEPDAIKRRVARRALREVAGTLEGFEHEHIAVVANLFTPTASIRSSTDLPNGISVERSEQTVYFGLRGSHTQANCTAGSSSWPTMQQGTVYDVIPGEEIDLDRGWKLNMTLEPALPFTSDEDNLTAHFDSNILGAASSLVFRTRRPGDHIAPFGLGGSKSLQDLFVDAKIPVDYRRRIPILAFREGGEVLWVPGRGGRRSSHAPVNEATESVLRFQFDLKSGSEGED